MKEIDYRSETLKQDLYDVARRRNWDECLIEEYRKRVQEQVGKKAERRLYNKAKEPSD